MADRLARWTSILFDSSILSLPIFLAFGYASARTSGLLWAILTLLLVTGIPLAYLHVLGDAISSVGVILAAALIWLTGWTWLDPLMSVFIGILIVNSSWRVLKSSLHILVEGVPEHLSIEKISQSMASVLGVKNVHDLHVWSICSGHVALSAHVLTADEKITANNGVMTELKARLTRFGIEHTTIQFECETCGQGINHSTILQADL